jgi:hypothetical protein
VIEFFFWRIQAILALDLALAADANITTTAAIDEAGVAAGIAESFAHASSLSGQ